MLGLLFLAALAVRLVGINFGLVCSENDVTPVLYARPDEEFLWPVAFRYFSGDLNPHFFDYPSLFSYFIALVYAVYLPLKLFVGYGGAVADFKAALAADPSDLILIGRILSASLGALTLVPVYAIARFLSGRAAGLVAAFFLAFNYLHARSSHFGVTDVPAAFIMSLALLSFLKSQSGGWRGFAAEGFLTGLAISTKWNAAALLPALAAARLTRPARGGVSRGGALAIALACVPAGFAAGTPFSVLAPREFWHHAGRWLDWQYPIKFSAVSAAEGFVHHIRFTLWHGMGWPVLLASVAGIAVLWRSRPRAALVLSVFLLTQYLAAAMGYQKFVRYAVPLLPVLSVTAAVCVVAAARALLKRPGWRLAAMAAVLALPSAADIGRFDRFLLSEDSRQKAARWFAARASPEDRVLAVGVYGDPAGVQIKEDPYYQWPPPFLAAAHNGTAHLPRFQKMTPRQVLAGERPLGGRVRYLVLSVSPLKTDVPAKKVLGLARERYRLIQKIEGVGEDPRMFFDAPDAFYVPYAGISFAKRPGPDLYIFESKKRGYRGGRING